MFNTGGLISPPPEETLQIASKRKRTTPQPQQTTPNPKPRKQSKCLDSSPTKRAPHNNPNADYRPRRTTPIPAYEPPKDVFTPPRVVIVTPTISKSSKRKKPQIKIEPPQIDLSAPMPPPSPTDDPILLSAASSSPVRPRPPRSLPPSSPPLFDVTDPSVAAWSDSDDDENVDEGDFTGRFRSFSVRTKLDPPSSATRERQEEWGRPITPFPFRKIGRLVLEDEAGRALDLNNETGPSDDAEQVQTHPNAFNFDTSFEDDEQDATEHFEAQTHPDAFNFDTSFEDNEAPEEVHTHPGAFDFDHEDASPQPSNPPDPFNFDVSFEANDAEQLHTHPDAFNFDTSFEVDPPVTPNQDQSTTMEGTDDSYLQQETHEEEPTALQDADEEADEREVREMSLSPDEDEESNEVDERQIREMSLSLDDEEESKEADERQVREMSLSLDEEEESNEVDERQVREMSLSLDDEEESNDKLHDMSLVEEAPITPNKPDVREMSLAPITTPAPKFSQPTLSEDDSSSSSDEELEYGVVKISSADPHAAARAAAILKQHDYDCFTKLALRAQKGRHSLSSSGITKPKPKTQRDRTRRRTLGASIIGDRVFIPGSPATTLLDLLKEAETAVARTPAAAAKSTNTTTTTPHLFTPVPKSSTVGLARSLFEPGGKGNRVWTKDEWKLLDACFTDERIALGPGDGQLVSVDRVHPENVVRRFVDLLGGEAVVCNYGEDWEMENLLQRVKALQNKQRKGIVAPPTTPSTPRSTSTGGMFSRVPSMEVPDFTPLGRRAALPSRRPMLPPPVVAGAPFSDLRDTPEQEHQRPKMKLPMSLLAPRYSHLLEEAVAVSQLPDPEPEPEGAYDPGNDDNDQVEESVNTSTDSEETCSPPPPVMPTETPRSTLKTRVKGFLFSYLPTLSKTPAPKPNPSTTTSRPGLPLPPPSMLSKSRGPISTPARAPPPKPTHPKELVHLHPAPALPPRASLIPRPQKPQRLVELHRVSPPPEEMEREREGAVVRPRRSSGCSVKDLVRDFEEMEKRAEEGQKLKRVKSVGEWRKTAGLGNNNGSSKPSWRP